MTTKPLPVMLGGIELLAHAGPVRQRYEPILGGGLLRLSLGAGVPMTHWRKTRIVSSGSGLLDPGLEGLDFSKPLELRCVKPKGMDGGLEYTLPAAGAGAPREDYEPWGLARVGSDWVETPLTRNGDQVQLQPVPGATAYRLCWMPSYWVSTTGVVSEYDHASGLYDWSLDAEQI